MELNTMNINSLQNTGIIMMILGYFGYILRDIPMYIWNMLRIYIVYSIEANTGVSFDGFRHTTNWLFNRYSIFRKHIECELYSHTSSKTNISDGLFYLWDSKYWCMLIVSKNKIENLTTVEFNLRINLIGFNKDKIIKEYKEYLHSVSIYPDKNKILRIITKEDSLISSKRSFDSIYNKNIDYIKNFIDKFSKSEDLYMKLGLVYKTGILLYGPPGSGKSSIARAIASYLDFEILYINQHTSLTNLSRLMPRTVVLIEDIDCYLNNDRENIDKSDVSNNTNRQLSFQDLLNSIDGILSPHNVIFVATTNYINKIDPALIRPGRFDCVVDINYMDNDDIKKMCDNFNIEYSEIEHLIKENKTGAEIQRILIDRAIK